MPKVAQKDQHNDSGSGGDIRWSNGQESEGYPTTVAENADTLPLATAVVYRALPRNRRREGPICTLC